MSCTEGTLASDKGYTTNAAIVMPDPAPHGIITSIKTSTRRAGTL